MKITDTRKTLNFAIASFPFINPIHFYPDGDVLSQSIAVLTSAALVFALYIKTTKLSPSTLSITLAYLSIVLLFNLDSNSRSSAALIAILPAMLISFIKERDMPPILWGIIFGASINALAGYTQLSDETITLGGLIFRDPSVLETTVYGNIAQRNLFTTYLFLGFLAAAQLYSQEKPSQTQKNILLLFLTLIIPPLTFSASRSTVLYTLSALLFLLAANYKAPYCQYTKKFSKITLYFVILLMACQTIPKTLLPYKTGLKRASEGEPIRIAEWKKTYQIISEYFPSGIGWGNYPHYSFLEQIKGSSAAQDLTWIHSHNIFLNLLCELGAAAIPLIAIILYLAFSITRSSIKKKENYFSALAIITLGAHSLLEYPLWYAQFFILLVLIINTSHLRRIEIATSKISRILISSTALVIALGCLTTILQYKYLAQNAFKSADPLENMERISKFNTIAANPYLKFSAELSTLNHIPIGSGTMRLCLLADLSKQLPTFTLLDKLAIELYTIDQDKLAASVMNSRFKAYPKESTHVLLDDTKGFPAEKQGQINSDMENAAVSDAGKNLYQLSVIPSCP
ncbi:Wzy polymerase domain-containing protein [Pseudomonas oryzihabitans]|uniref:PglL family O-oligosaccharyltransferase n=1 Tax=Pseudomonas oryzihabitans TaxID=47885 RepID=UPI002895D4B9|nr:Wzy polymerase domain-containing protein [Pseudomonas oryzihabitans]MDT3718927.1 Wzy polymerase domain-containing protein [Pseudomonas oryzihabitans]